MKKFFFDVYRLFFARKQFVSFNKMLIRLGYRGLGVLNYESDFYSGEKYFVDVFLPKYLKGGQNTIFDIGANVGDFSKLLVDKFPDSNIYSFEPHPITFKSLEKNTKGNIKLFNAAFGNFIGKSVIYDYSTNDGSEHASLIREVISEIHDANVIEHSINIDTLDNFVLKNDISSIDFLKIDTEGFEYDILKGAKDLLAQRKIMLIQFEFNSMNTMRKVFLRDFKELLPQYNFYRLMPNYLLPLDNEELFTEVFAFQNIIAILR